VLKFSRVFLVNKKQQALIDKNEIDFGGRRHQRMSKENRKQATAE